MSKTIKQIADELCVSKQAVWQRVKRTKYLVAMLAEHSRTVNGRIYIDEELEQSIKALYSSTRVDETSVNKGHDVYETSTRVDETNVNKGYDVYETSTRVDETSVNKEYDVDETSVNKEYDVDETSVNKEYDVDETSVNTADDKLLDTLQQTVSMLQQQLLAKDKQIEELTAILKASQDQQATLASALTAAQALHAGTIQDRLTEHAGSSEDLVEDNGSLADQGKEPEDPKKKLGLFARIFGKKKG